MPHQQALATEIVAAMECRPFCAADERQVQKFDCESGEVSKLTDIDLHQEFLAAADQAFMPAPQMAADFTCG